MRPAYAARRLARHARLYPAALLARRRLRTAASRLRTFEEALDFASTFRWADQRIRPAQVRGEILELLLLLEREPPRAVLEIGTLHGGTLFLWTRVAAADALIIGLDYLRHFFGSVSPQTLVFRSFARQRQRVEPLTGADSHEPRTVAAVESLLAGRPLDFVFVDGDHTYEGVKRDFELYAPLVRHGGIVAFHDVSEVTDPRTVGVAEFWRDFKREHETEEIVVPGDHVGSGIGIYRVP